MKPTTTLPCHDYGSADRFQWGMLGYVGLIWFADAMELMMLSFIGPAVGPICGACVGPMYVVPT